MQATTLTKITVNRIGIRISLEGVICFGRHSYVIFDYIDKMSLGSIGPGETVEEVRCPLDHSAIIISVVDQWDIRLCLLEEVSVSFFLNLKAR